MRSFSNIMPNFAANLHLLVDSIWSVYGDKITKLFPFSSILSVFFCNFAA